jgi:GTPase
VTDAPPTFRSGFVAVVGRPNVGKSTLVNSLVGIKVAITSDRPQTTRSAIRGVLTTDDAQIVFVDTPGYHKPKTLLGKRLNQVVREAWSDVDVALFVVDGAAGVGGGGDEKVAADLAEAGVPTFCVVNKIDRCSPNEIAAALMHASALGDYDEFIPVSARSGQQVDKLRALVSGRMPEGPLYYPPDMTTDQPPPVFVAEVVREKLLGRSREELPHSIAVVTDDYIERDDGILEIHAAIYVERESQKGIVIGKGGTNLKRAGTETREELEVLFGRKVYIELRVKVEKEWQRHAHALERLGFGS